MKKNLSNLDRIIRLVIFIVTIILFFTKTLTGVLGITFLIIGAILALTTIVSFCPIYRLFGINTCKIK